VLQAADGHQALTVAQQHRGPIDLLLTDVVMPQLSGPELARHLRRLRPRAAVLYMSGYADSRLARRGVDEPHVHLIHKPFEPAALLRTVANLTSTD
jgi:two-component system, cell cycle sensor histidine kinase and response regulator CckA